MPVGKWKIVKKKCSFCKSRAVTHLPYCKRNVCSEHFTRMFDKRFRDTVRLGRMIDKGDRVAVALSGGKDSMVLLHSLSKLSRDFPFEIVAISVDEGIKGYRAPLIRLAKKECKKLSVEHVVGSFKAETGTTFDSVFRKDRKNPCSYCGTIRRYILNKAAREVGAKKLATGHNLDDVVQTFLMNIMRNEPIRIGREGSGDDFFVPRMRPLRKCPEDEILLYANLNGIPAGTARCPYASFAFRNHARRIVKESRERYPDSVFKMSAAIGVIRDAVRKRGGQSATEYCSTCGSPTKSEKCRVCSLISNLKN